MIRARRRLHGRLFGGLAVILPALVAAALLDRSELPPLTPSERALFASAGFAPAAHGGALCRDHETRVEVDGLAFEAALHRGDSGRVLTLRPVAPLLRPDLLVYWTGDPGDAAQPGDGAILLGRLAADARRSLALPPGSEDGQLLVLSLGHREVVARLPLARLVRDPAH